MYVTECGIFSQYGTHGLQLLGSAYGLGASSEQLTKTYEHDIQSLVQIDETFTRGDNITKENWRQFLREKSFVPVICHGGPLC